MPDSERATLSGRKIVLIDDLEAVTANFLPAITSATGGHGEAILHSQQSAEELAKEVLAADPDIVLIDYNLANNITGTDLASELRRLGFTRKIIGFSSENRSYEFRLAGADGSVIKSIRDVQGSLAELARVINRLEAIR